MPFERWPQLAQGEPVILVQSPAVEAAWLPLIDRVFFVEADLESSFCTKNQTAEGLGWYKKNATAILEDMRVKFEQASALTEQTVRLAGARSVGPFPYRDLSGAAVHVMEDAARMKGIMQREAARMISTALGLHEERVLQRVCGGAGKCH